jgi:hypothetical protein
MAEHTPPPPFPGAWRSVAHNLALQSESARLHGGVPNPTRTPGVAPTLDPDLEEGEDDE